MEALVSLMVVGKPGCLILNGLNNTSLETRLLQEKKRAVLLSVCRAETYKLIRNLVAPGKLTSKSFKQLVELVRTHLNPKVSIMVKRFKFHRGRAW